MKAKRARVKGRTVRRRRRRDEKLWLDDEEGRKGALRPAIGDRSRERDRRVAERERESEGRFISFPYVVIWGFKRGKRFSVNSSSQ